MFPYKFAVYLNPAKTQHLYLGENGIWYASHLAIISKEPGNIFLIPQNPRNTNIAMEQKGWEIVLLLKYTFA